MKIKNVPYFKTSLKIDNNIKKSAETGWLTTGPMVKQFESEISDYTGAKYVVAVNSCTDALYFSLLSLNLSSEDEVLLPAYSFLATATCVLRVGAKPVFIDVDDDGLMNLNLASKLITKNTKVLIYVNLFGLMRNPKFIRNFVKSNNLILVEDNAQAFGASYKNIKSGSVGDISCFSFVCSGPSPTISSFLSMPTQDLISKSNPFTGSSLPIARIYSLVLSMLFGRSGCHQFSTK